MNSRRIPGLVLTLIVCALVGPAWAQAPAAALPAGVQRVTSVEGMRPNPQHTASHAMTRPFTVAVSVSPSRVTDSIVLERRIGTRARRSADSHAMPRRTRSGAC